jgi:predicted glycogen debranching enzyme
MIELKENTVSDLEASAAREWIETNGIGGYASSTVCGANTRRYHGLLVAARRPPLGRVVLLSKLEETVVIGDQRFELSCNKYPGAVHPDGYKFLTSFRLDPFPVWAYEVDGVRVEKKLFMTAGQNTTVVVWRTKKLKRSDKRDLRLEVRPLVAFRDYHQLRHESNEFEGGYNVSNRAIIIETRADLPPLYISNNAASIEPAGYWYRNFEYAIERERGFDYREDLYQPCQLVFDLKEEAVVVASTEPHELLNPKPLERSEIKRRKLQIKRSNLVDEFLQELVLAADQFIVSRGTGKTIIAGYHWFSDWGRDAMISLPGLTLSTNQLEIAKSILKEFSKHISQGLLPNRFPDEGEEPEYNTVDATLWFFEAVRAYVDKTGDLEFVRDELFEKLVDIIDWHVRGTRHQIHVDTDGLLYAGEPGVQLTWMDARVGDWVVTPRIGKPVEIQALWYNALRTMADLAAKLDDAEKQVRFSEMADIASRSFNGQFWNQDGECLFDVVNGAESDASIRPNQIFAVSLKHSMLDAIRARKVTDNVEAELLTPVGLRSLSPSDPKYVGVYAGSPAERDAAYHQGTVWAWLIGPFIDAYGKTHQGDKNLELRVEQMVSGLRSHLNEAMLGQISEIFDGDPPHAPRGCGAQAWSVAELLRVLVNNHQNAE